MNHSRLAYNRALLQLRTWVLLLRNRHFRLLNQWTKAQEAGNQARAEKLWAKLNAISSDEEKAANQELRDALEQREPSPWLLAMGEAHECEKRFDWEGAKAAYHRAAGAEDSAGLESGAYRNLSALHSMLDEDDFALEWAQRATQAARGDTPSLVLAIALGSEASLLVTRDTALARERIAEQLRLLEDKPMNYLPRLRACILRARCAVEDGDLDGAEHELELVWRQIKRWQNEPFLAGHHGILAAYWTTRAALGEKRSDWRAIQKARLEAVEHLRFVASFPPIEGPFKYNNLALALLRAAKALRHQGDARAEKFFAQSRELRQFIVLKPLDKSP